MAKPNYSFEKRQRELAKKRKKEEKSQKKASPATHDAPEGAEAPGDEAPPAPAAGQNQP